MRLRLFFAATSLAALAACSDADGPANDADTAKSPAAANDMEASVEGADVIAPAVAAELERQVAESYDDWEAFDIRRPPFAVTPRLEALLAAERAYVEANGEPRYLDFDWHVGGQDAELSNVTVDHEPVEPGMVVVTARFANFGQPTQVHYVWLRQNDGRWALDDATLDDPDGNPMSLGEILSGGAPY